VHEDIADEFLEEANETSQLKPQQQVRIIARFSIPLASPKHVPWHDHMHSKYVDVLYVQLLFVLILVVVECCHLLGCALRLQLSNNLPSFPQVKPAPLQAIKSVDEGNIVLMKAKKVTPSRS
jgi:hypothetical protein